MNTISLAKYHISVKDIRRNIAPAKLYREALVVEPDSVISDMGALIAFSGEKTGRSPTDKRLIKDPASEMDVWWGPVNIPIERDVFETNLERATDYLNTRPCLYVIDGFAGWDPLSRLKIRVICSRPYHALFMHNMLIRPTESQLLDFGEPDFVIFNAGQFPANRHTRGMTSKTSVDICLESKQMVLLGTEYAGEMKKGVFTLMNYFGPKNGILTMHCSATADPKTGQSSLLFGLSGTGKTTLSADPTRQLIGDDEHGWDDRGVFNIEGGCYAKAIYLSREREPDIFQALRFGAVLENVVYDPQTHHVDFDDATITQNTRGAYPIEFIPNARIPCIAGHPTDVIFLTCDAFGVLPPLSRLNNEQAMFHFMNGYTAKVAGTEMGIKEPQATFSPCFGGPFLVWHPSKYASLLAEKLLLHGSRVWMINTGWSGGPYGIGKRIHLDQTRAMLRAIHEGTLHDAKTKDYPHFQLSAVTKCPGVFGNILEPEKTWKSLESYQEYADKLARLFQENIRGIENGDIRAMEG